MADRSRRILRLNPGNLPETAALEGLSSGLEQVRRIIARETIGAVSPRRQLLAVDAIGPKHRRRARLRLERVPPALAPAGSRGEAGAVGLSRSTSAGIGRSLGVRRRLESLDVKIR
jgi:hypothetical protein